MTNKKPGIYIEQDSSPIDFAEHPHIAAATIAGMLSEKQPFKKERSDGVNISYGITAEMVREWSSGTLRSFLEDYMIDILNGEYDLKQAREDVLTFHPDRTRTK